MSFAVIKTGGKQYKIAEGDTISVEKLSTTKKALKPGDKVVFDEVLLFDDGSNTEVGTPVIKGMKIEAELVDEKKQSKVTIIKFKSKSRYKRKAGHRQTRAKVKITKIGK